MDNLKKPGGEEDRWQNDKLRNAPWKACMALTAHRPVLLCGRTTKAWAVKLLIKKAASRDDVISLCKTQSKHNSLSRLIWEAGHPAKKENAGFCLVFFPRRTAQVPTIYFRGWILEETQYWQFIYSPRCLCSNTKGQCPRRAKGIKFVLPCHNEIKALGYCSSNSVKLFVR